MMTPSETEFRAAVDHYLRLTSLNLYRALEFMNAVAPETLSDETVAELILSLAIVEAKRFARARGMSLEQAEAVASRTLARAWAAPDEPATAPAADP